MMSEVATTPPEFSYEIDIADVGKAGKAYDLCANEDERRRIAARIGAP